MNVVLLHFESKLWSTLSRGCTSSVHWRSLLSVVSFLAMPRCLLINFKIGTKDEDSNSFWKLFWTMSDCLGRNMNERQLLLTFVWCSLGKARMVLHEQRKKEFNFSGSLTHKLSLHDLYLFCWHHALEKTLA